LPILRGIITDSHFSERQRVGRTIAFLARMRHDGWATRLARPASVWRAPFWRMRMARLKWSAKARRFFLELAQRLGRCSPN
jgi:hypothetical protein